MRSILNHVLTKKEKIFLVTVVLACLGSIWFLGIYRPIRQRIQAADTTELEDELSIEEMKALKIQSMQKEITANKEAGLPEIPSYNSFKEEIAELNKIFGNAVDFDFQFSEPEQDGSLIRRNVAVKFDAKNFEAAKEMVKKTGRKYMVYYSERIHVEAAVFAGDLIKQGAIGTPIHVDGFGPHRVGDPASRPDWFFEKEKYGGILCDIGSHQIEQFLYYCDVKDATIQYSQVGNYNHPDHPGLEDFGDAILLGDNGTTEHFRVDWFTPEGLSTWGDGRTFILGTEGYIELRKYVNVGTNDGTSNHVFFVNKEGEQHFEVTGKVGYPYFGQLILDCINRTENAMTQEHAFKAAELCVKAEMQAKLVKSANCRKEGARL